MKKLMVIGVVGVCSLIIGVTVIAAESSMSKKAVATGEKKTVEMYESAEVNLIPLNKLILPETLEEKKAEPAETSVNNVPEADTQQAACNRGVCTFTDANHDGFCDYGDIHYYNGEHMDANNDGYCDYGDHYCIQSPDVSCNNVCGICHNEHNYNENCAGNATTNQGSGSHHSGNHHGRGHH